MRSTYAKTHVLYQLHPCACLPQWPVDRPPILYQEPWPWCPHQEPPVLPSAPRGEQHHPAAPRGALTGTLASLTALADKRGRREEGGRTGASHDPVAQGGLDLHRVLDGAKRPGDKTLLEERLALQVGDELGVLQPDSLVEVVGDVETLVVVRRLDRATGRRRVYRTQLGLGRKKPAAATMERAHTIKRLQN